MRSQNKNMSVRFSVPVKVVAMTGFAYVCVWALELALIQSGLIDPSATLLGVRLSYILYAFEIMIVAMAATIATHIFLNRPLTKLSQAMSMVEGGDFLIRAPILSHDELGILSDSFNRLLIRITDLSASRIQADYDLLMAKEQLKLRNTLEEKSAVIARTNKALEHLVRDLSMIYEIGQEVNSVIDLDVLYNNITEALRRYLRIEQFAILIFDDKNEELIVKAAYGFEDGVDIKQVTFKVGEGVTGLVAQTGKKIYIRDTSSDSRFLHYKGERPQGQSSFLSIPLIYKDDVMGVINFSRKGISNFTHQDVKMLSLVANQVALSIANARLYTKTRELSVKDDLIGINNRRHFQHMLQMEWKRSMRFNRSLSLIMIDADHFKSYNDTFGHLQGDKVLKQIGKLLMRNLREVDTVARFGGEEFVLLLPDTDKRGAIAVAEKVRALVEACRFFDDNKNETARMSISAGVATYPDDVSEMDDLIDRADIALYKAKELGRNRVECFTALDESEKVPDGAAVISNKKKTSAKNRDASKK